MNHMRAADNWVAKSNALKQEAREFEIQRGVVLRSGDHDEENGEEEQVFINKRTRRPHSISIEFGEPLDSQKVNDNNDAPPLNTRIT